MVTFCISFFICGMTISRRLNCLRQRLTFSSMYEFKSICPKGSEVIRICNGGSVFPIVTMAKGGEMPLGESVS